MFQGHTNVPWGRSAGSLLVSAALCAGLASGPVIAADGYEPDVVPLQAKNLLPKELLKGANYEFVNEVSNRGYMNNYKMKSDFGEFAAMNDTEALVRTHEIKAIAELKKMSTTGVVADAVVDTTARTAGAVAKAVQSPEETIRGVPEGVGRLFQRTKRTAENIYDKAKARSSDAEQGGGMDASATAQEAAEHIAKQYVGVNSAFRRLAKELNVNPYTDNAVLRAELERVAQVAGAASFGTNILLPIPAVVSVTKNVSDLVWNMSPTDLLLQAEKELRAMGADDKLIKALIANKNYTPDVVTVMVGALRQLGPVPGRLVLVRGAAAAQSKQEAYFHTRGISLLAAYHSKRNPIMRVEQTDRVPLSVAKNGAVLVAVAVDYLTWSENTAQAASYFNSLVNERKLGSPVELWAEGRVSPRATSELEKLGWRVNERAFDQLGG